MLQQFERTTKEIRKAALELDQEKLKLVNARNESKRATDAFADAAKKPTKDFLGDRSLDKARQQLGSARQSREAADAALDTARKSRDQALKNLKPQNMSWDEYKRQSRQLLDKSEKEIGDLSKRAAKAKQAERRLENAVETRARALRAKEFASADSALKKARTAEDQIERGIRRRAQRIEKLGREAVDIAKRGKSWVFKKIVGPRMLKVLGFLAKAVPILNLISLAVDLYEIGKLLWNWDKLKFGIGGGDGGAGGSGSGGTADPSGKGSGTGAPGKSPAPGQGPGTGTDPWDPATPVPSAPAPGPDTAPPGGAPKPDPQGTSKTGTGTKPTGTGSGGPPPQGPVVDPAPPGSPPGPGNDPTGTQDDPGGAGKPGGKTGTGTTGGGTTGAGQGGGGMVPPKKPGKTPRKKPGKPGGKPGGKPVGGKGGKGDDERAAKQKPKAVPIKYVRAVAIAQAAADDIDVFALGATPQIAKFGGINKWTAGKNGAATKDVVTLTVKHDGQVYRVSGVPIRVTARTEDIPPNTADRDEYLISLRMEVTKALRLQGTKLVINPGDELSYTWNGSY